jgi:hypothetical protein
MSPKSRFGIVTNIRSPRKSNRPRPSLTFKQVLNHFHLKTKKHSLNNRIESDSRIDILKLQKKKKVEKKLNLTNAADYIKKI